MTSDPSFRRRSPEKKDCVYGLILCSYVCVCRQFIIVSYVFPFVCLFFCFWFLLSVPVQVISWSDCPQNYYTHSLTLSLCMTIVHRVTIWCTVDREFVASIRWWVQPPLTNITTADCITSCTSCIRTNFCFVFLFWNLFSFSALSLWHFECDNFLYWSFNLKCIYDISDVSFYLCYFHSLVYSVCIKMLVCVSALRLLYWNVFCRTCFSTSSIFITAWISLTNLSCLWHLV